MRMIEPAIFTIVSNNYLHFARTLLRSARQHHPQAKLYCVIVDTDPVPAADRADEFEAIPIGSLPLPDGDDFLFQYTVLELNTAVKPWAIQHLLDKGHERVFYIDPDILIYQPLREVEALLEQDADIVLTPHLLAPMNDEGYPSELDIRRAGTYNLGFCAVRDTDNTRGFLAWWQGKLRRNCIVDPDRGVFVDQSWVDLAPGLFDNVAILRHPGYNAAYWNLAQRKVTRDPKTDDTWRVNGQPLVFFHFSGLNPLEPHKVSIHQNRHTLDTVDPDVRTLVTDYCRQVVANGIQTYKKLPYGYACYHNGTPISPAERIRFRTSDALRKACSGNPFGRVDLLSPRAEVTAGMQAGPTAEAPAAHANAPSVAVFSTLSGRRLERIYRELLGRQPDPDAIEARLAACGAPAGMLRTALAVGLSAEARGRPGWQHRLLSMAASTRHTPGWAKRWAVKPLLGRVLPPAAPAWNLSTTDGAPDVAAGTVNDEDAPMARYTPPPRVLDDPLPVPAGINLIGYLAAELGLGEAARSLAKACHAVDVRFSVTDVGYQTQNLQRDTSVLALASAQRFPIDFMYVNADQVEATVARLRADGRPRASYTIGFWHWEQPQLPRHLLGAFTHLDEVWVPSTFVHDAIAAVSPVPVFKVPHALTVTPSPGASRGQFGLPAGQQLVLVMYDFQSYQHRKNPQAAIAAYRQAVRQCPQLGLVIKTINSHHHPAAYAELRDSVRDLTQVHFIDEFLTRQQTWDLQACCDVLLSLHRAEGFGLAPAEMMALGKPVVATGWSANMDFMNADNSMPVRYRLEPLAHDVGAYPAGPLWAEADVEHAAWCLVQLVGDPRLARRLGRQAAHDIRAQLNPAEVGQQIRQRLRLIGHWHPQLIQP